MCILTEYSRTLSNLKVSKREFSHNYYLSVMLCVLSDFYLIFLGFDFCRFCVVILFFHPRHNGQ